MSNENFYDVVVIGGGPAGLTAALYLARACYRVLVIEKEKFGGQITITDEVVNYPGVMKTSGKELTQAMQKQAEHFGAEFLLGDVVSLKKAEEASGAEIWETTTDKGSYKSFGILLATGAHPRMIGFPGEAKFRGHGVAYCATCDGAFFKGKTTAVVGGGDVALEDALFLARLCKKVYLIHRRDEFRGAKVLQERVKTSENIEILWDTVIEQIQGEDQVESLSLYNKKTEEKQELSVNGVFIAVGILPNTEMYRGVVDLDEAGYVIAGEDGVTSCAGIFAAGDLRTKQLRQVITAAADGANVVTSIEKYLNEL